MRHLDLFESFDREEIFYKIIDSRILKSVMSKGIIPNKKGGTWLLSGDSIDDWIIPNKIFGSMLQALLYFPSRSEINCTLLRIKIKPDKIKIRDVNLMLVDMNQWKKSLKEVSSTNESDMR